MLASYIDEVTFILDGHDVVLSGHHFIHSNISFSSVTEF